jgi:hypothetical protein
MTSSERELRTGLVDFARRVDLSPYEATERLEEYLFERVKDARADLVRLGYLGRAGDGRWTVEFDQALTAFRNDRASTIRKYIGLGKLTLSEEQLDTLRRDSGQRRGWRFDDPETNKRIVMEVQLRIGIQPGQGWGQKSREALKAFLAARGLISDGSLTVAAVCATLRKCQ